VLLLPVLASYPRRDDMEDEDDADNGVASLQAGLIGMCNLRRSLMGFVGSGEAEVAGAAALRVLQPERPEVGVICFFLMK
jgi:hypothetical protein